MLVKRLSSDGFRESQPATACAVFALNDIDYLVSSATTLIFSEVMTEAQLNSLGTPKVALAQAPEKIVGQIHIDHIDPVFGLHNPLTGAVLIQITDLSAVAQVPKFDVSIFPNPVLGGEVTIHLDQDRSVKGKIANISAIFPAPVSNGIPIRQGFSVKVANPEELRKPELSGALVTQDGKWLGMYVCTVAGEVFCTRSKLIAFMAVN